MLDLLSAPTVALSVSELNEIATTLLDGQLSGLWIAGEVGNLTRASSGHHYFVLKDAHAQIRCAMFKHVVARLPTPLREGAQIEIRGKVGIYAARGEFQIAVQEVRQIGAGVLHIQFEQLKNRLQNEGLFQTERKKSLPEMPQKIGIVTSLAAAALRDVVSTLRRRAPHLTLCVYPTAVQGAGSSQQIAQAIEIANVRREVDVLIVCRGGGSLEDLWAFNEESTVRAISGSQIPIVCGVGHETDFTLSDMAADVRAPTPTAAAELVSPSREQYVQILRQQHLILQKNAQQLYQRHSQTLDDLAQQLQRHHPKQHHVAQRQALNDYQQRLQHAMQHHIQQQWQRLHHHTAHLEAVSPLSVLRRGFAVASDSKGKVVRQAHSLKTGQKLTLRFANDTCQVQVLPQQQQDLFD